MQIQLQGDFFMLQNQIKTIFKRALKKSDSKKELGFFSYFHYNRKKAPRLRCFQTVDKALLLQGFAIVGTAFLI